ncbi:MAG TPA: hypothetical protein VIN40_10170 [Candidatus Tyrphobacter sp.]
MITRPRTGLYRSLMCLAALAVIPACSFTTAHLTSLTVAKDSALTTPTTTFAPTDTIYAQSGVANIPGKVTMQWHLIAEHVTGQPANTPIPQVDKSFDLSSDGTSTYDLSPPTAGWPAGTYRIEVDMMVDGQQKDQKTAEFTVAPS